MHDSTPTIAVLGASPQRHKFGNKCVRAYLAEGWRVVPVHPRAEEIEGQPAHAQLSDVGVPLDRLSIYLPPPLTLKLWPEIEAAAAGEIWLNPGCADERVLAVASRSASRVVEGCSIVDIGRSPSEFP